MKDKSKSRELSRLQLRDRALTCHAKGPVSIPSSKSTGTKERREERRKGGLQAAKLDGGEYTVRGRWAVKELAEKKDIKLHLKTRPHDTEAAARPTRHPRDQQHPGIICKYHPLPHPVQEGQLGIGSRGEWPEHPDHRFSKMPWFFLCAHGT